MDTLDRVRASLNRELEIEGVLMTMYDDRTNLSRQVVEEVRGVFGDRVYKTVVPRNIRLGEAPSYGKPIFSVRHPLARGRRVSESRQGVPAK